MKIEIMFDEQTGKWWSDVDGQKIKHSIHLQTLPPMAQGGRYHAFMSIVSCLAIPLVGEAIQAAQRAEIAASKNGLPDLEKDI